MVWVLAWDRIIPIQKQININQESINQIDTVPEIYGDLIYDRIGHMSQ